jgi:hypothetical protein
MPRPPPPAEALTRRGWPRRRAHSHRNADALGELLRGDLVAEGAHHRARRSEEFHASGDDLRRELGIFGDEAPSGPHGVGVGLVQGGEQEVVVEVGGDCAAGRREPQCVVGVAHEGGVAIDVGVESDALEVGALDGAQRLHGANAANGGLAAVDDGQTPDAPAGRHRATSPCACGGAQA